MSISGRHWPRRTGGAARCRRCLFLLPWQQWPRRRVPASPAPRSCEPSAHARPRTAAPRLADSRPYRSVSMHTVYDINAFMMVRELLFAAGRAGAAAAAGLRVRWSSERLRVRSEYARPLCSSCTGLGPVYIPRQCAEWPQCLCSLCSPCCLRTAGSPSPAPRCRSRSTPRPCDPAASQRVRPSTPHSCTLWASCRSRTSPSSRSATRACSGQLTSAHWRCLQQQTSALLSIGQSAELTD
jgi:hypothetical protein